MYKEPVSPLLKCNQNNDKFSTTDIGNKNLTHPIGLATADELIMSGYILHTDDSKTWSYDSIAVPMSINSFWTMTSFNYYTKGNPFDYEDGFVATVVETDNGVVGGEFVPELRSLRPVISLKADTPLTGNGSYETPFIVQ